MTGRLDLTAFYLFAIIFYWTPPHFWALALIKKGEYAKAGVPMLPVVQGDRETKVQMLVYTLMLLPLTILPALFGAFGLLYAVTALALRRAVPLVQPPAAPGGRGDAHGVEDVQVLAGLPGAALRGHERGPLAAPRGRRRRPPTC